MQWCFNEVLVEPMGAQKEWVIGVLVCRQWV